MNILLIFHVALSLVGLAAGFVVVAGLVAGRSYPRWTAWFLICTAATSLSGFFFPFHGFTPAIGVGIVSTVVLAVVIYASYSKKLAGEWRPAYVLGAVFALYLNFFVLIAQAFAKVPALKAIAPTQKEAPFVTVQALALMAFAGAAIVANRRFRPGAISGSGDWSAASR